ncbi:MAG: hypothetical protein F6J93_08265 [Oscillatoria sp. SIO1A7]|nr:hypothetical protein [Oscillatoria sp. SIO1A7]
MLSNKFAIIMRVASLILLSALFLGGLAASFREVKANVSEPSEYDTSSVRIEHHPDIVPSRGGGRRN